MPAVMDVVIFSQLFTNWYRDLHDLFNKSPIFWSILLECVDRAWRGEEENKDTKLSQWEFYLSKQEYVKFWLKESQSNQISRKLNALQKLGFIRKVDNKRGNNNATVYKFLPNTLIVPPWMMGNTTGNWPKKTGNQMDTNKENIKKKNKREGISPEDVEKLITSIRKTNDGIGIAFTTGDQDWYAHKLLSDQTYDDIIAPLETKSKQQYPMWEWIAKIYKHAMTNKNDEYWKWKISSFKNLYEHLQQLANLFLSSSKK